MGLENYFRQIPTLHSRDFCPARGASDDTKFGGRGTLNFGAFDGEFETLTPNSSTAVHFSGPKFISGKGMEGPYLPAKTGDPGDTLQPIKSF